MCHQVLADPALIAYCKKKIKVRKMLSNWNTCFVPNPLVLPLWQQEMFAFPEYPKNDMFDSIVHPLQQFSQTWLDEKIAGAMQYIFSPKCCLFKIEGYGWYYEAHRENEKFEFDGGGYIPQIGISVPITQEEKKKAEECQHMIQKTIEEAIETRESHLIEGKSAYFDLQDIPDLNGHQGRIIPGKMISTHNNIQGGFSWSVDYPRNSLEIQAVIQLDAESRAEILEKIALHDMTVNLSEMDHDREIQCFDVWFNYNPAKPDEVIIPRQFVEYEVILNVYDMIGVDNYVE